MPDKDILKILVTDKIVMIVIIINSFVLFLGAFPDLHKNYEQYLFPVDYICTLYFVFEVVVKVRLRGWNDYWVSGWNKFDFIIVVFSAPMLLSPLVNTGEFAVILLLRMGRLLRFFKLAKFIPNQERLWSGIKRAIAASVGFLVTLSIYNFILAIGAAYFFSEIDPDNFGNPIISIYSMFKVFTVEGWYEIPDSIAEHSSPLMGIFARIYFVFTVLTGGVIGLSIANAVFVDEMVMDNTDILEEKVDELKQDLQREIENLKVYNKKNQEDLFNRLESLIENKFKE